MCSESSSRACFFMLFLLVYLRNGVDEGGLIRGVLVKGRSIPFFCALRNKEVMGGRRECKKVPLLMFYKIRFMELSDNAGE